jgi:hypothetical protein
MDKYSRIRIELPNGDIAVVCIHKILALGGSAEGTKVFLEGMQDGIPLYGVSVDEFLKKIDEKNEEF